MRRVALYCEEAGAGLLDCSRHVLRRGDRVVSAKCETDDAREGRQELYALVDRMLKGEFDAIIASLPTNLGAEKVNRLFWLSNTAVP